MAYHPRTGASLLLAYSTRSKASVWVARRRIEASETNGVQIAGRARRRPSTAAVTFDLTYRSRNLRTTSFCPLGRCDLRRRAFSASQHRRLTHPDAQRQFRVIETVEELAQALDFPCKMWMVFFHP